MNPYAKAARLLLRLVAAGLVLIAALDIAAEYFRQRAKNIPPSTSGIIMNALLALAGVILFFASGKLADKIAERLDE